MGSPGEAFIPERSLILALLADQAESVRRGASATETAQTYEPDHLYCYMQSAISI